jgi:hypothetical protein
VVEEARRVTLENVIFALVMATVVVLVVHVRTRD